MSCSFIEVEAKYKHAPPLIATQSMICYLRGVAVIRGLLLVIHKKNFLSV